MNWRPGKCPITIVLITLNEEYHLQECLDNLSGWAKEVCILDSFSTDQTIEIARQNGAQLLQKEFRSFGEQWNYALDRFEITTDWVMKIDPDERVSDKLKSELSNLLAGAHDIDFRGIIVQRRLWFMGRALPIEQPLLRVWKKGSCRFSDVLVNEYPIVDGKLISISGRIEHFDSPDLEHWLNKQNKYTTAEALSQFNSLPLSFKPSLLGSSLERRMFMKKYYPMLPFRHLALFLYYLLIKNVWIAGRTGLIWARLRIDVMRFIEYKKYELKQNSYKQSRRG